MELTYKFKATNYSGLKYEFSLGGDIFIADIFSIISEELNINQFKSYKVTCEGNLLYDDYDKQIKDVKYIKNHLMCRVQWINNIVLILSDDKNILNHCDLSQDDKNNNVKIEFNMLNYTEIAAKLDTNYTDDFKLETTKSYSLPAEEIEEFTSLESKIDLSMKLSQIDKEALTKNKTTHQMLLTLDVKKMRSTFRPSIDIVFVIDKSGSMTNDIDDVKKCIEKMLGYLEKHDRVCIFIFNDKSVRLTPLLTMTPENKLKIMEIINTQKAHGGTDIFKALKHTLELVTQKNFSNNITSIFLLSDGMDDCQLDENNHPITNFNKKIQQLISYYNLGIQDVFSINSFGYSPYHDPVLLTDIANIKNGNFYFIDKVDKIGPCFYDCLGMLSSTIGQNAKLFIKTEKGAKITKIHGMEGYWKYSTEKQGYQASVAQLCSGKKLNYLFDIEIDQIDIKELLNIENSVFAKATCKVTGLKEFGYPIVEKTVDCFMSFTNTNMMSIEENFEDILIQSFRVKCGEVIKNSMKLCGKNENVTAAKELNEFAEELDKVICIKPENIEIFKLLKKNITNANLCVDSEAYKYVGNIFLQEMQYSILGEKSNLNCCDSNDFKNMLIELKIIEQQPSNYKQTIKIARRKNI